MDNSDVTIIVGETGDQDFAELATRVQMSNYLVKPCPICGKAWKDVDDLIASKAIYAGDGAAAHEACWKRENPSK